MPKVPCLQHARQLQAEVGLQATSAQPAFHCQGSAARLLTACASSTHQAQTRRAHTVPRNSAAHRNCLTSEAARTGHKLVGHLLCDLPPQQRLVIRLATLQMQAADGYMVLRPCKRNSRFMARQCGSPQPHCTADAMCGRCLQQATCGQWPRSNPRLAMHGCTNHPAPPVGPAAFPRHASARSRVPAGIAGCSPHWEAGSAPCGGRLRERLVR